MALRPEKVNKCCRWWPEAVVSGDKSLTCPATGELVFGVARIFASFNDTFVHITDLRLVYA